MPNPLVEAAHAFIAASLARVVPRSSSGAAQPPLIAVDGTAGNGHDTLFLARCLAREPKGSPGKELAGQWAPEAAGGGGEGKAAGVLAWDAQAAAIASARARVQDAGLAAAVTFFAHGHERLGEDMAALFGAQAPLVGAAMFNFGYLPGGGRACVTQAPTTLAALAALLPWLRAGAGVSLHLYAGHAGGAQERAAVLDWAAGLPWPRFQVEAREFVNKAKNPETLLLLRVNA